VTKKLLLAPLIALTLFAQTSAPEPPVYRANARLVEVNVVVHDKNGAVGDLTQQDFTLFDKGKAQKISSFALTNSHAPQPALAPNVFSNRPDQTGASITVILLDGLNTRPQDQVFARQQFAKVLSEIKPADRVAVYTLGARLHILSDIGSHLDGGERAAEDWLTEAGVNSGLSIQDRLNNTVATLVTIAGHIGHLPGRKNLVWVAGNFPVQVDHKGAEGPPGWETAAIRQQAAAIGSGAAPASGDTAQLDRSVFQKLFDPAMQALALNNISVYAVDVRGLVDMPTSDTAAGGGSRSRGQAATAGSGSLVPPGTDAMRTLTEDTGGRVFDSSNEIQKAIRRALDDAEVTYTLSYYPDSKSLDKNFHDLKVQVSRKGVDLFYRKGYLAVPEPKIGDAQRLDAIRSALVNPLASGAIGLMGGFEKSDQPKAGSLRTTVIISASDLQLQHQGDQWTGDLEVILTARSADGKDRGTVHQPVALKLPQAQYEAVLQQGIALNNTLQPTGDVAEIRAVVADRLSGRVGSLIMAVK
jgi:VWFA-related protein